MNLNQQGLTLVELMVTLAVAIILLAVGVPLFTGVTSSNRAAAQANTFLAAFKLARSEAVRRTAEVSVCAVADPTADPVSCGTDDEDWTNGLLVFTDGGTAGSVDGGDERIRVFAITTEGATAASPGVFVRFGGQGGVADFTEDAAACGTSGTCIEHSHSESSQTRCLHVMQSGQVRLERAACS